MKEQLTNPYFLLFHGAKVLRSSIEKECPPMLAAVDILAKDEKIIGQYVMADSPNQNPDVLLWMKEK